MSVHTLRNFMRRESVSKSLVNTGGIRVLIGGFIRFPPIKDRPTNIFLVAKMVTQNADKRVGHKRKKY